MHKREQGHRDRGSRLAPVGKERVMRFAGIDIAAETHVVAIVDETVQAGSAVRT